MRPTWSGPWRLVRGRWMRPMEVVGPSVLTNSNSTTATAISTTYTSLFAVSTGYRLGPEVQS